MPVMENNISDIVNSEVPKILLEGGTKILECLFKVDYVIPNCFRTPNIRKKPRLCLAVKIFLYLHQLCRKTMPETPKKAVA
jgi:hypothetical protein